MRIAYVSSVFPRPYAPARGIYCLALCKSLAARHAVQVVSPESWLLRLFHRGRRPTAVEGLPTHYLPYYYPPGVLQNHQGWFMWASVRARLRRLLTDFRPDCILSYWLHPDGEVAVRAAHLLGVPAAVMVGGSDALVLTQDSGRRRTIRRVLGQADAVIAVSKDIKSKLVELGTPDEKVHVIYRGVDTERFLPGDQAQARRRLGLPEEGPLLLYVGNLVSVKGVDVLLDACALLRQRGTTFRLCLVGDGPLRHSLAAAARAHGLESTVTFVGPLPHDQLPDWYRAADLTVLASRSEGIPNVLRESLACGIPFVATRVGGIAELGAGPRNRLVAPGDPEALVEAITDALAAGDRKSAVPSGSKDDMGEKVSRLLQDLVWAQHRPAVVCPSAVAARA